MSINPIIFHDYDIRGTYPDQLNEQSYYLLGRALASYISAKQIAVGYDCRRSSPALFEALTRGIMEQGSDVINLGNISTEIHYFASGKYQFPANAIISASHNPPQYNGLKVVRKGVVPLHGGFGFPQIKEYAMNQNFPPPLTQGSMTSRDLLEEWVAHALTFIDQEKLRPLRVVVDAGNGMAGISWERLIGKLPVQMIPLYFDPDGNFPNHLPDPLDPKNLTALRDTIQKEKADLGFAMDGDADRLFIVDNEGRAVSGTVTAALLAGHLLKKYGPAPVLYNVVCGRIVPETIKKFGGTPRRVRVGHSFIKQYMKEDNALFAGEHSGHFYFRDNYFADSSLIAGLVFLEFLSAQNQPLSAIVRAVDSYPQSGEINFTVADMEGAVKKVKESCADADSTDDIDGVSIWYKEWWCNIRLSKTEPLLRLNVEADTRDLLDKKVAMIEETIIKAGGKRK